MTDQPITTFRPKMYLGTRFRLYEDRISDGKETHDLTGVHAEVASSAFSKSITVGGPGWAWVKRVDGSMVVQARKFAAAVNAQAQPRDAASAGEITLERLAALHLAGSLTDAEFTAAKAQALGLQPPQPPHDDLAVRERGQRGQDGEDQQLASAEVAVWS